MKRMIVFTCFLLSGILSAQALHLEKTFAVPPENAVRFSAIARTGQLVAGACADQKIRVWDVNTGSVRHTLDLNGEHVSSLLFSQDAHLLAAGGGKGAVRVWDLASGDLKLQVTASDGIRVMAIAPDNQRIAVAPSGMDVELWNIEGKKSIARLHPPFSGTADLAFSPDGRLLATADEDTNIRIYETGAGSLRSTIADPLLEEFAVAFSPDGKSVYAGGADKTITVIDVASAKVVRRLPKQSDAIAKMAASPDGNQVAAAYMNVDSMATPAPILIWDLSHDSIKTRVMDPDVHPNGGGYVCDGRLMLTSSSEKELKVWSVR